MKPKTLSEWQREIHRNAIEHGWWENPPRTALEIHALIHSEISEATEAVRNGDPHCWKAPGTHKPEGEAVELADAVIRILDYFGAKGWNLEAMIAQKHAYNRTRPHRHGGKTA